jgi:parvulin-like peptidyl-prolyl isomerase
VSRVFKQVAISILVAFVMLGYAACGGSKSKDGGSDVAATVNGKEITLAEVDRLISTQMQGQQLSPIQQAAARLTALDNLIQREAVVLRAEKEKIAPTEDEITTAINNQKSQRTPEQWDKFLKDNKLTEQQLRDEARKDLAISKLQEKLFGKIVVREQEITDFYNNNPEQYKNPRGVALSDIVADPRDSGGVFQNDAKSDAEAAAKINSISAQLKTGADFATVARAYSEDQSSIRGGDIGFAQEDDLRQTGFAPDLINRLFNTMKVGDVTEPIHFPDGRWIIFKLTNRQLEAKQRTADDPTVREDIKQGLIDQRRTILKEALIRSAMSDAQVVNKLAADMLNDPNMLGGLQQASSPGEAATPAGSATPAASPAATSTPGATPAAAAATPKPAATSAPKPTPARPTAAPSPKQQ